MKTIILFILLAVSINAQSGIIPILMSNEVAVASRDSVPAQFTFTDSTGAAVSTQIISLPIVPTNFDSAYVNVVGGDYRIGALGSITRLATIINLGDSLFAVDTTSASASTTTNVAFTIGGIVDTFSVTTVAGESLPTPTIYLVHNDDSTIVSGSKTVRSVTLNGYTFADDTADVNGKIVQTDSSLYFGWQTGIRQLLLADASGNPFDLMIDGDMTVYAWVYVQAGDSIRGRIMSKGDLNTAYWTLSTGAYDGVISPVYSVANADQDTVGVIKLNTPTEFLSVGWRHLAASYDKSAGIAILYVDSVITTYESGVEWTNLTNSIINTASGTYIGQTDLGHLAALAYYYNVVLTPAQIKQIFELGRP